eukprot:TRINITY_DN19221_c0_g1_i4.p1 TRINITY_DN19221_c0_g1~~TRINITY_DN19221_c0_g1_i4.p1  ORF type:complete len:220 (+),score=32.76 TRINITY_DN19221_c0_g1_i4:524-1183(+)
MVLVSKDIETVKARRSQTHHTVQVEQVEVQVEEVEDVKQHGSAQECPPTVDCNPAPMLTGCAPPVSCAIGDFEDEDSRGGYVAGTVTFGPAVVNSRMNESTILRYEVFEIDDCEDNVGAPLFTIEKQRGEVDTCCSPDVYSFKLGSTAVTAGVYKLKILAITSVGPAPVGIITELVDKSVPRKAHSAAWRISEPGRGLLGACLLALAPLWLALTLHAGR